MGMHWPRDGQVAKLIAVKKAHEDGKATDADVLAVVRESTGYEINQAMDRHGDRESWRRIKSR